MPSPEAALSQSGRNSEWADAQLAEPWGVEKLYAEVAAVEHIEGIIDLGHSLVRMFATRRSDLFFTLRRLKGKSLDGSARMLNPEVSRHHSTRLLDESRVIELNRFRNR